MSLNIKPTVRRGLLIISLSSILMSCSQHTGTILPQGRTKEFIQKQEQLKSLLNQGGASKATRYAQINLIANNMLAVKDYNGLILFLTSWTEDHPDDEYNAYWLLMTAYAYMQNDSAPMARYYFERILRNYNDLIVQGHSVHFLCLRHLIQISDSPANKISYFSQLINRFPDDVSKTELYVRMAMEYEKEFEWSQALNAYELFTNEKDAASIQIKDIPNAYNTAKQLVDMNKKTEHLGEKNFSERNWTFETLDDLVAAVQRAISTKNGALLDSYKSQVNFFATSWRQDEDATNALNEVPMSSYMMGRNIRYSDTLDESSTPMEAYMRTWGWSSVYVNVWYFYFRKINFPANPNVHGRWEWAGIYYGEKL